MQSHYFQYQQSVFHYQKTGSGNKVLLCLHGYGLSTDSFHFIFPLLAENFTCYAIDLPFHGKTIWNENQPLTPAIWWKIVLDIIPDQSQKIVLLGYSMGGRIALQMLQHNPNKIEALALIAPDGLHTNFWQWISTQTKFGNYLFKQCMHHPLPMHWMVNLLHTAGIMPTGTAKFVRKYLTNSTERELLYLRWTTMRLFFPQLPVIGTYINQYQIGIELLFGKYDTIIKAKWGRELLQHNRKLVRSHTIHAAHNLLKPQYAAQLAAIING